MIMKIKLFSFCNRLFLLGSLLFSVNLFANYTMAPGIERSKNAQLDLDDFLGMHGFHLSPLHSGVNEGYMTLTQKEQFRDRLKSYSSIRTIMEIGLNGGHSAENFL